jgi:hypothetical protein
MVSVDADASMHITGLAHEERAVTEKTEKYSYIPII